MSVSTNLSAGFSKLLEKAGKPVRIKYYSQTIGSVWDDDVVLAQSGGDVWVTGIVLPLSTREGSQEQVLVQQGKLTTNDTKLYVNGSISFAGSILQTRVQLGSPTGDQYTTMPDGVYQAEISGTKIYNKVFLTRITSTGSLIGES